MSPSLHLETVGWSQQWSLYLRMLEKGLQLKTTALIDSFMWLTKVFEKLVNNRTFFYLGLTPCKAEQPPQGTTLRRKRSTKRLQQPGNLFRKNVQLKDVC